MAFSEVEIEYQRRVASMPPMEKMARSAAMLAWTRQQIAARIQRTQPDIIDAQLKWRVALKIYEAEPAVVDMINRYVATKQHLAPEEPPPVFPGEVFQRTIGKFVSITQQLDIPFHITGGAISSAYGEPRLTQDIDFVIAPQPTQQQLELLLDLLRERDFFFTESVVRRSVATGELFQLLDTSESLKLDIYPRELIPGELQRSESAELFAGVFLPVVSHTDAALSKLVWIDKGSWRSRRDVRGIFRNSTAEQQADILSQARRMGLGSLLEAVLAEEDEIR